MDLEIAGISYDSRQTRRGDLFVAVTGFASDGHRFIGMAKEKDVYKRQSLGFAAAAPDQSASLRRELETGFSGEFLGRLDAIVPFHAPGAAEKRAIAEKLLEEFRAGVSRQGRSLQLEEGVTDYVLARWDKDGYGVRSLQRTISRELADPLAELLVQGKWNGCVRIRAAQEGLKPV